MAKGLEFHERNTHIPQGIVTGALIGGIAGTVVGLLVKINVLNISVVRPIFTALNIDEIITGVVLGILIGAIIGSFIGTYNHENKETPYDAYIKNTKAPEQVIDDTNTAAKMQLREEKLDISKHAVQVGEVNVHKEVFTEEKNIIVPITHEELVIEKKVPAENAEGNMESTAETIRIPLSEERVNVTKEPVVLEDVQVHRNRYEEKRHIEEILRREQMAIKTKGSVKIRNKNLKDD